MTDNPKIDPKTGHSIGQFTLVCDKYGCEMVDVKDTKLAKLAAKHGVDGQIAKLRGLAVTQMPTDSQFIPKTTFNEMLKDPETSLVGRPIADRHGYWPWDEISVAETVGVVTKSWYDDNYESLMFEAEIWDPKAINSIKYGTQKQFSIAYYYDSKLKNRRDWYDELQTMAFVTWMECNHLALLSDPQVLEAELVEDMEMLSECKTLRKEYPHTSNVVADAPAWGSIEKTRLPFDAFVFEIATKGKKSTYKYPHHWVSRGKMYLHRQGLAYAIAAAKGARSGKRAGPEVFAHLNKHLEEVTTSLNDLLLEYKEYLESFGYDVEETIEWYGSDEYTQIIGEIPMEEDEVNANGESPEEDSNQGPVASPNSGESGAMEEQKPTEETPTEEPQVEEPEAEEPEAEEEPKVEEPEAEEETEIEESETDEDVALKEVESLKMKALQVEVEMFRKKYESMKLERDTALAKQAELEDRILSTKVESRVDEMIRLGRYKPTNKDTLVSLYKTMSDEQIEAFEALSADKGVSFDESGVVKEPEPSEEKPKPGKKFRKPINGYTEDESWKIKLG